MNTNQKNYKTGLILSIHISHLWKTVYKDDRELYETMLENTFGKKSSKDLSISELKNLDAFMHQRGDATVVPKKVASTENQLNHIKTIWTANSRNKDLKSLLTQVKKVIKRDVNALESLTKDEAGKVIASIKNIKPPAKQQSANNTDYKGK